MHAAVSNHVSATQNAAESQLRELVGLDSRDKSIIQGIVSDTESSGTLGALEVCFNSISLSTLFGRLCSRFATCG